MKPFNPSDLKTILHSKRANLYYIEHCRLLVKGGRVEYVTDDERRTRYWNIPIANTTTILLGTGTSITQAAVRELAKAGVMIGFCGGGGTPLLSAIERDVEVAWLSPQSEYRPPEYLQAWARFWFDDTLRLQAAKRFQNDRLENIRTFWVQSRVHRDEEFEVDALELDPLLERFRGSVAVAADQATLLLEEARLTKELYRLASRATSYGSFARVKRGEGTDPANRLLDQGNYLAYGLAATASWVLGIPSSLAVLHGKTRRGGLVFDVADLIKDALILPQAFLSASKGHSDQEFRDRCVTLLTRVEALDLMIGTLKETASTLASTPLPSPTDGMRVTE